MSSAPPSIDVVVPVYNEEEGLAAFHERYPGVALELDVTKTRYLDHDILEILDAGEDNHRPFYVMAYHCNNLGQEIGETYRAEAPSRPLTVPVTVDYGLQILDGLVRLHHAGIVHRDIKPSNIMLDEKGEPKLMDFGIAHISEETSEKGVWGTPSYMSPEQLRGEAADGRSDIFALGVMLYELATGRKPFAGETKTVKANEKLDFVAREAETVAIVRSFGLEAAATPRVWRSRTAVFTRP